MQLNLHTVAVKDALCDDNQNLTFYAKKISLLYVWKKIIEICDMAHTRRFVFYLTRTNIRFDNQRIQGGQNEEIKPRNRKICISLNSAERIISIKT
jgi:hypothetical protein